MPGLSTEVYTSAGWRNTKAVLKYRDNAAVDLVVKCQT